MSGERIKKSKFLCAHMPCFCRPSHIYALRIIYINNNLLLPICSMHTTGLNCHHLYEAITTYFIIPCFLSPPKVAVLQVQIVATGSGIFPEL